MKELYKPFSLLFFCGVLVAGCDRKKTQPAETRFEVTDALMKELLIDTVRQANASTALSLTGKVMPDEDKMVRIYPMVSGITENVRVHSGDYVKKGQVLALMRSAEVADYTKESISAKSELSNAKRNMQATQDLYTSGMASERDVEQARNELEKAQAESRRTLAIQKINPATGDLSYIIKSPIDGFVVEKNVTSNMQVRTDNADNLFTVANLSEMWVMVNMYESDIARVQTGDTARITTLSYPEKIFTGYIDKIYDMLDPVNKVVKARVRIANPKNLLKPGMFAQVNITGHSGSGMPVVNARTIIFDKNKNYVLVADAKNKIRIQPVVVANRVESRAFIADGLKAGDRVIASRQVYLYESLKD
ncbi:MAG: efflux RND transporter periplasmic adaptor subunit [Mucilaginibacter polytrichastri]|nr:efflux RND transporter periplasmic adaptor subunit [Mucilaginibacter polytrichastri]